MRTSLLRHQIIAFMMILLLLPYSLGGQALAATEVSRLVLTTNEVSLEIGDTYSITATAIYTSGATADVTIDTDWSAQDATIASVYSGTVSAKAVGSTLVTASYAGQTVVVNVTVDKKIRSLTKNKTSLSIRVGNQEQITLMATYTDGTTADVTTKVDEWSTSNDSVATVTDGLVTGVSSGNATITATYGSKVVTVSVDVDLVRRLDADQTDLALKVSGTQQIKLMALFDNGDYEDISNKADWSSDKDNVADAFKGLITAYDTGEATITGKYGNKTVSIVVHVDISKRLETDQSEVFLHVNNSRQLTVTSYYADGTKEDVTQKAKWSSDNEDTATVSKGNITAYTSGKATITAAYGGKTTSISVDVEVARKLELDVTSIQLNVNKSQQVILTATYADGTTEDVTSRSKWASDNEAVAIVSNGKISSLSSGEAIISAQFGLGTAKVVVDVDVAKSLTINKDTLSLRIGGTEQLTVNAALADGQSISVTNQAEWSSDNEAVAYVTNGKVVAVSSGQAIITVKYGDTSVTSTVQVEIAKKLTADQTDLFLKENDTQQIKLLSYFSGDGSSVDVTDKAEWSSEDDNIAYVSKGLISGSKMGQTTITAKYGGKTANITVDVAVPRKLTMNKSTLNLRASAQEQLTLTATFADGQTADITDKAVWFSDNEDAVIVNYGKVSSYKVGHANLTATYGGKTSTVAVNVDQATTLSANKTTLNLQTTDTQQITLTAAYADGTTQDVTKSAEWTTKTATVATVKEGLITALDTGASTITARYGDSTVSIKVTVGEVSSLTLSQSKLVLKEGDSAQITLQALFADGKQKDVTSEADWSSSSDKIAKVYEGTIKSYESGKAVITVKYGGQTETITVEVDLADKLSINQKLVVMDKDAEVQLVLTATHSNRQKEDVTLKADWKTSSDKIADVSSDGLVTSYGNGKATITATYGGKSATVPVEVNVAKKIYLSKKSLSLKSGEQQTLVLKVVLSDDTEKDITSAADWTTSSYTVADVNAGVVTATQYGKTTITAKYSGKSASLTVNVDELKYLKVSEKRVVLAKNTTQQLKATLTYKDGTTGDASSLGNWTSNNELIADVKDGLITAYGKGTALITCRYAGKTTTVQVIVK